MPRISTAVQAVLRNVGLYQRLKSSYFYDCYYSLAGRHVLDQRRLELAFYRGLLRELRPGDLIMDIGANNGGKTDLFLRLGARVVCVEPDESNQEILRQRFLTYRLDPRPVTIVGKAASDHPRTETIWIHQPGSAMNTLSNKWATALSADDRRFGAPLTFAQEKRVETTTLDQLIAVHGRPYFIKIDVEGYEANVLRGLNTPVPFLSFEVNLPEFVDEGTECIARLGGLAYEGVFNYAGRIQQGLALEEWLTIERFLPVFNSCKEPTIEVIWKTSRPSECR